ncbi:septum formation inhibitor Maf [Rhodococcus sp. BP-252]|uniref:Nucleoside triphosphate pyrophosphatase n=1 Tax=Rhodococcoides kyotonense TaxID=398843 RepID=A0A177Y9E1_9NOCA|nr:MULTISPECIES: nucleoside triphosphate pyrophosphatase [Rhodococcus]NIL75479.1 Maf-like protein [Rhodococcus sp. B10]MBY6412488.1 septum formation inhibitor Maf [Rhodococcus sp. BP-320]MBY6417068.1 septum formation inhibitor Maf [Rhodococcus sp. BP-321]MBY6424068.1 septum formation inhibitor Maf [Rhodococcus sp. BP-324]MBY6427092.1 septum formation inhibitor Maf [Rhodococcus sp. BP-323]
MTRFVLASASPARLEVLRHAGVEPVVRVSGVDEDALTAELGDDPAPDDVVVTLARAKAEAVLEEFDDAVVVGCDSMLSIGGVLYGKPHTVDVARERWALMAGKSGDLLTGHAVVRVSGGRVVAVAAECSSTTIHFAEPSAGDLEAYLATGEPLSVAGAFTLDGLGGWFVDRIEGDPSSVIGIGLPLVRRLLTEVGTSLADIWSSADQ